MGQPFGKLFPGNNGTIRILIMGLGSAGKTTIVRKLQSGDVSSTVDIPTVGPVIDTVHHNNVSFVVCEIGGQLSYRTRSFWKHYTDGQGVIYVVDCLNFERFEEAKQEFQDIINDPSMLNSAILVFANKQDLEGAMTPMEVCEGLGLLELTNRKWHVKGTCARRGDNLHEGFDWLVSTIKQMRAAGHFSEDN